MFGRKSVPAEFINLLVEADSYLEVSVVLREEIESAKEWLKKNNPKVYAQVLDDVCVSVKDREDNAEEDAADLKKEVREALRVEVPEDKAIALLEYWTAVEEMNPNLKEMYLYHKMVFEVCPQVKDWPKGSSFCLEITDGKLFVVEGDNSCVCCFG
jgi:hypothetical protein